MKPVLIYVAVDGYNVEVWSPVDAVPEHDDCYRIVTVNDDPEHWYPQFDFGDVVRCENHTFAEGEFGLVAREKCEHNST
ncbi:MAG TPA: hypothetical protein VK308_00290 [Pyrinomonadaceae bacterium]|nr:hypothetical protein [Pyrinomonadaceae bacterium]